jgi:hypothetical protein
VANETAQPLNDVDILPQGAFAYLAGGNHNVSVYATCNSQDVTGTPAVTPAGTPTILRAVPNGSLTTADPNNASSILTSGADVLAINSPFIDDLTVTIDNVTGVSSTPGSVCIPPGFTTTRRNPATNPFDFRPLLGGAGFTANQLIVTSNGSNAFILDPGQNVILKYNVPSNTGSTIALANNAHPTSGGVTLDGASLYVGGSDGNVHLINLSTGSDTVISLSSASAPAKFAPDFVAVVP